MELDQNVFRFLHPFTALIAGPTGSGKTYLTRNLLSEYKTTTDIEAQPLRVLWCHGQWQKIYAEAIDNTQVEYHEGLADERLIRKVKPHIIILDDLMAEVCDNREMSDLFTKKSHHLCISVIFIVQNMFKKGKEMRDIRLNCHQLLLLKIPQDINQVRILGRQIFPSNSLAFNEAYEDATHDPHSYLNIDCSQTCPNEFRLKSRLTRGERKNSNRYAPIVYIPIKR